MSLIRVVFRFDAQLILCAIKKLDKLTGRCSSRLLTARTARDRMPVKSVINFWS